MHRTFQSHISYRHYALLAVLLLAVVCFYWMPLPRPATGLLLGALLTLMVVAVSRAVSTCYVVRSDGILEIHKGRLSPTLHLNIADIRRIDKMRQGGTLIIVMKDGTEHAVSPKNESDFIRCIEKYHS